MIDAKFSRFCSNCVTLGMSWYTIDDQALYNVSSQIDVRKHVQSSGFDSLFKSSSRSLKICQMQTRVRVTFSVVAKVP